jgi:outer membrane protein TolC
MKTLLIILFVFFVPAAFGQEADSLARYVAVALRDNPTIKAARLSGEAAARRVAGAGALEDPVLEAGIFIEPMEYPDGRQRAQFQVMQMFPWFGTRRAARAEMGHMAAMAGEEYREAVDNLMAEVATRWNALCLLRRRQRDNEENVAILEQLERLALQRFAATGGGGGTTPSPSRGEDAGAAPPVMGGMKMGGGGGGATVSTTSSSPAMGNMNSGRGMAEVLQLRLELVGTRGDGEAIRSEMAAAKAAFNALLDRPAKSPVILPDSYAPILFRVEEGEDARLALARNPMLGMIREETLAREAAGEMARGMGFPMIGIGLQYMLFEKKTPGMVMGDDPPSTMNGKDMVMPMVSISIPVHRGKRRAARAEADLLARAGRERHAAALRQLEAELFQYHRDLEEADRKIALYREQAAITRTLVDLGTREFAAGRGSLDDLLRVRRQLLEYGLREAEAVADHNAAVINVRRITSFPDTLYTPH